MKIKKLAKKASKSIKPPKALKIPPPSAKKAAKNLTPKSKSSSMNMKTLGKKINDSFKSVGNKIKDVFSPQVKVKNNRTQCPKDVKLVKVGFMPGQDAFLKKKGVQIVNLPPGVIDGAPPRLNKNQRKWVDGEKVTDLDRLGRTVRVRATIKPAVANIPILYRLVIESGNAEYTNGKKDKTKNELGRNERFRHDRHNDRRKKASWKKMYTNKKGVAIGTLIVSQAGKNQYQVEARLPKAIAKKGETPKKSTVGIETSRVIYVQQFAMDNNNVKANPSLAKSKAAFAKIKVDLEVIAPAKMLHLPNIGTDQSDFRAKFRAAYHGSDGQKRAPYILPIAYTDHLAVKNQVTLTTNAMDVGPGKSKFYLAVEAVGLTNPALKTKSLWQNLVPGESWLIKADFLPTNGSAAVNIASLCEANPKGADNCKTIAVDISKLAQGNGSLKLSVYVVDRMRGGLALGSNNGVLVCTRAWWTDVSFEEQSQIATHELGHKVQMAADGNGNHPDRIATFYDSGKGHVGSHCYNGNADGQARYDSSSDRDRAICVMYGATKESNQEFCSHCEKAGRKVDISDGWLDV